MLLGLAALGPLSAVQPADAVTAALPAGPAHAVLAAAVPAVLLPVPAVAPGGEGFFAVGGAGRPGVLVGTVRQTFVAPDGSIGRRSAAVRWSRNAQGSWVRQTLARPPGAAAAGDSNGAVGIDARGNVAGSAEVAGRVRAVLWSPAGVPRVVGPAVQEVSGIAPDGTLGLVVADSAGAVVSPALRSPTGVLSRLATLGASAGVLSVGGSGVAITRVTGPGTISPTVVDFWTGGRSLRLAFLNAQVPIVPCPSRIRPDGAFAWTRAVTAADGTLRAVPSLHTGGVPGVDTALDLRGGVGIISCLGNDTIARDGTIGGSVAAPGAPFTAAVWRGTQVSLLPLRPGENLAATVGVATGGRAVVLATTAVGDQHLYAWSGATVRPLVLPQGWRFREVVDYSEDGLVVATLVRPGGLETRPVVWQVPPA